MEISSTQDDEQSSRSGVGSLICVRVSNDPRTVSGVPRFFLELLIKDRGKAVWKNGAKDIEAMHRQTPYQEAAMVEGFRLGEEKAFSAVFEALHPALCYYATQLIHNSAAAEDLVSTAFLKVWQKRDLFQQWNTLKSYLYTTVRHSCIDWLRKEQRAGAGMRGMETEDEKMVLDNIIKAELLRELYAAIDQLPAQCRRVMEMIYINGKSSREIAEDLSLSVSSVRNQKARGLGLLRKMVQLPVWILLCRSFW